MQDIYKQRDTTFAAVSAYAIGYKGEFVARVALKFPKTGDGAVTAYIQFFGMELVRGRTTGTGFNKRNAAVARAMDKLAVAPMVTELPERAEAFRVFVETLSENEERDWRHRLEAAGFQVWQAV